MARPTTRKRHQLSQAVIDLRASLGDTQQQFAARLNTALSTVARYETNRPPSGTALTALAAVAAGIARKDLAALFMDHFGAELEHNVRVGHLSLGAPGTNPRGVCLMPFEGDQEQSYVRAFFETFTKWVSGNEVERATAQKLLDQFTATFREEIDTGYWPQQTYLNNPGDK